jgi:hypothetical protein
MTRRWRHQRGCLRGRSARLLVLSHGLSLAACVAGHRDAPVPTPAPVVVREASACIEPAAASEPSLVESRGRLAPQVIELVVERELSLLRGCYASALERSAGAAGQINVRFVIDASGRVTQARAEHTSLPDCDAVRCVLDVFRGLRFPEPDGGGLHVLYPVLLAPG